MEDFNKDLLLLGMALAEQLKVNDFEVHERLRRFMARIQATGNKHTLIFYRGDGLVETERSEEPDLVTYWLGDKKDKYVFVREHGGVQLAGMVSVRMYVTLMDNMAKIVMDVWPVTEEDDAISGVIWLVEGFGHIAGLGNATVFSSDCLVQKYPFEQLMGTVNGFCFGMVLRNSSILESKFVLSNFMERVSAQLSGDVEKALPLVMTPFGVGRGQVLPEYPLTTKWLTTRPQGMEITQFLVLQCLFENGARVISQEEIHRFLKKEKDMSTDEAWDFLRVVTAAVRAGWLERVDYAQYFYYTPTPRLYSALS